MKPKAVVAMSGGVDSSVAAALMKEDGYDVTGIMLKLWKGAAANNESGCCSLDAAEDARRVAQVLDIPFYVFNFADYFSRKVISNFVDSYAQGYTPNPCVECNRSVKFDALLERTNGVGASILATGHYARIENGRLLRGLDSSKDQSYVLYMLGPAEVSQAAFPVGEYRKQEIRQIADELGLRTASKPESQEICFVPDGDVHAFLNDAVGAGSEEGPVVTSEGERIGSHRGFAHYTVGQRRGLGVALGVPVYVREVRAADNTVVIATEDGMDMRALTLDEVSFVSGEATSGLHASVMTRYRGPEAGATIENRSGRWIVDFDEPCRRAAPGQAAVFYRGEEVVGGGRIVEVSDG